MVRRADVHHVRLEAAVDLAGGGLGLEIGGTRLATESARPYTAPATALMKPAKER